ncbi:Acyl-coenzyme A thioesterase 8 [Zancudomyces culisetae]|uniref:Acyl-coenzyme A thioesterase 8 n=1 Tax=Zancudomyces culisetae TaxID=1213189 RepID=A0A1R1PRJ2_ZANCU|nr:Acyl-coenzyme A thioesterase 8 [Zancudomyces culisetae]|eukprot:OMH83595.1 Acyl-coenzyme A thioesterase 8 [Zancudomyces culisetae]
MRIDQIKKQLQDFFFLQEADKDIYFTEVTHIPGAARGVFGGQVVAQSLACAILTVDTKFRAHSLHSYFLLAGKKDVPIYYHVERIRDGKSFASRTVVAKQKGKIIFSLSASFQKPEFSHITHQHKAPAVIPINEAERKNRGSGGSSEKNYSFDDDEYLVDVGALKLSVIRAKPEDKELDKNLGLSKLHNIRYRAENGIPYEENEIRAPYDLTWYKIIKNLEHLAPQVHQCILAYISDWGFLSTSRFPHAYGYNAKKNSLDMTVSLDHTIWFHSDIRVDKRFLFESESTRMVNSRALVYGRVYNSSGELCASVSQEGLVRASNLTKSVPKPLYFKSTFPKLDNTTAPDSSGPKMFAKL